MGRTRRKKTRTHVARNAGTPTTSVPCTFVMERGKVGSTLNHLVLDLRKVMEPFTASRLKVRQRNVLKDFVNVAGPLGVTHFIIVSRTEDFINLRVCRLPRGPTLTFHVRAVSQGRGREVDCLSLSKPSLIWQQMMLEAKDVISSQRKPVVRPSQFLTPALLVLNNFSMEEKPHTLMATMFQHMFPSITIQSVNLSTIRRCVLFHLNPSTNSIEFRHYNIRVIPRGMSRGVRKVARSQVPNLSKYQDISDYVLGGYGSESEGEELGGDGEVTLPQDLPGRGNLKTEQSAVRLSEIGPRLSLQLVKIESGLCEGEVLHHEFIHKSKREVKDLKKRVESTRKLKEKRKHQQEANILRKKHEKDLHRQKCLAGQGTVDDKPDSSESEDDDREWYRQEVGEEPDPDTFVPGAGPRKRKVKLEKKFSPKAKRLKPSEEQPVRGKHPKIKFKGKRSKGRGEVFRVRASAKR